MTAPFRPEPHLFVQSGERIGWKDDAGTVRVECMTNTATETARESSRDDPVLCAYTATTNAWDGLQQIIEKGGETA